MATELQTGEHVGNNHFEYQQSSEDVNMYAAQLQPSNRLPPISIDQNQKKESIWRIVVDIISLIILLIITLLSHYIAKPFTRGFFCSDTSIQYPNKSNTIPTSADVILSVFVPVIWMLITEFAKRFYYTWYPRQLYITRLELCGTRVANISPFIRNLYLLNLIFFYGYLATFVLTEIAKNFVGELRPHFLAVCRPTFNCSAVTSLSQFNSYLQYGIDYTCQNTDDAAVRDARRSFFSGHSSSIFYGFGWLIMYIHVSWSRRFLGILGNLFQVGLAILAFYIGYSRISDFKHHWHDVLVGGIAGSLIAFVAFKFILHWRNYSTQSLSYIVPTQSPIYQRKIGNYRRMNPNNELEHIRF